MEPNHEPEKPRDEDWVKEKFGDVGPKPTDEVVVDPDAPESPNTAHPE